MTSQDSPDRGLFFKTLRTLERLNVPYMIVGAFAATLYGLNRSTFDIDIVVDLGEDHLTSLALAFPLPRYYADPEQMRDSLQHGMLFNIIDTTSGEKADLVPLGRTGRDRIAFGRRRRRSIDLPGQPSLAIWCASPEDVIVGKLAAWSEGRSRKHPDDIHQMLLFLSKVGPEADEPALDMAYVETSARAIGNEALSLWRALVKFAEGAQR
ncbi:MAG: hypothetical protein Q8P22_11755 [Chloroflexota bacterium]|nr:hypothetical protein [Chloroflexota bacterium]